MLTPQQKIEILQRTLKGHSQTNIAKDLGYSRARIQQIIKPVFGVRVAKPKLRPIESKYLRVTFRKLTYKPIVLAGKALLGFNVTEEKCYTYKGVRQAYQQLVPLLTSRRIKEAMRILNIKSTQMIKEN